MKLAGDLTIHSPRQRVGEFVSNALRIRLCAPGVQKIDVIGPYTKYRVTAFFGLGAGEARSTHVVKALELDEPNHGKMKAHGTALSSAADAQQVKSPSAMAPTAPRACL